jgi:hypothetical protein
MIRIPDNVRSNSDKDISSILVLTATVLVPVKVKSCSFLNERVRLYNHTVFGGENASIAA